MKVVTLLSHFRCLRRRGGGIIMLELADVYQTLPDLSSCSKNDYIVQKFRRMLYRIKSFVNKIFDVKSVLFRCCWHNEIL